MTVTDVEEEEIQMIRVKKNFYMLETQKKYNMFHNNWKFYDAMIALFSMIGLILAIISFELDIYDLKMKFGDHKNPKDQIFTE